VLVKVLVIVHNVVRKRNQLGNTQQQQQQEHVKSCAADSSV
jgi:heme exporter protein D